MLHRIAILAIGALALMPGCSKKEDASATPSENAQAAAASASAGEERRAHDPDHERGHEWDGGHDRGPHTPPP